MIKRVAAVLCLGLMSLGLTNLGLVPAWTGAPAQAQLDASLANFKERGDLRKQINNGTVGIVAGGIDGTYIRIASDLSAVLDRGYDLRILPVIGEGSLQNVADALYLKGIDIGIVQSDVLAYVKREGIHPSIERRINYITKLYNEELHLIVGPGIESIADLARKKVNFGSEAGGTFMTASIVFETLDVEVQPTNFDQALALEKVKSGELAGTVYIVGKPASLFRSIEAEDGLRLLPVPYTPELLQTYLPAQLSNNDYPGLIPEGQRVETLAVGAVMAVYNWKPDTWRYAKVERFIDAFFSQFNEFRQAPRHPKWREVSLTAQLPGWTRFPPAERWLATNQVADTTTTLRDDFQAFLSEQAPGVVNQVSSDSERDVLFEQFLLWQKQRTE